MELRQLRYFVRIVELGSISRAALDLDLAQSALSQQIVRLESELSTRLLNRTARGVTPTEAGLAFFREAKLTIRHSDQAVRAAQQARLSGSVTIGLAPTTSAVLGLPLMQAMQHRYPDIRLHMTESMSGHLAAQLYARQLDLAVLFDARLSAPSGTIRHWQAQPLLEEDLYLIRKAGENPLPASIPMKELASEPLILPTSSHGLRSTLETAFASTGTTPRIVLEVDSLAMVMDAVNAGLGSTLQPWAALGRFPDADTRFQFSRLRDVPAGRVNLLCSLPDDELSPAALAARNLVRQCAHDLIREGRWQGTHAID